MSDQINLNNNLSPNSVRFAEFRMRQGKDQVARVGVRPGGTATVPTGHTYKAQAFTMTGRVSLSSEVISFTDDSAMLLAQMEVNNEFLDFNLELQPGSQPSAIVCENTWKEPVTIKVWRDNSPLQTARVVSEHNTLAISTAQEWEVYAIVDGITTQPLFVDDPNAVINLLKDNNDSGYYLQLA
ncbi:MAG: hypothetical protein RMA76_42635 [Deltaproteobacteria bacterium]|jgi:hypothetical protein